MKNALFATTALVAAGFAGSAFAAEPIKASVRGYANIGIGYVDSDTDTADGVGVMRDGEVHIRAKGSSDNGLTFEFRMEFEFFGTTDYIDENYVKVSGAFGEVMIGGNDTAMSNMAVGVFYGPGSLIGYYDHTGRTDILGMEYGTDYNAIHYTTPNFSGFQASITYAPDGSSDDADDAAYHDDDDEDGDNVWSVGVSYAGEFDGISIAASGCYSDADGPDMEAWSVGLELGAYGFGLGVHFEDNDGADAGQDLAIGLKYSTGPWTVAGGFATLLDAPAGGDVNQFGAWVTYKLMPGVSGTVGVEHSDGKREGEATAGIAYLSLNF